MVMSNFKKTGCLALCILLLTFWQNLPAQNKYWVKFNNKNGTPYTVGNPSQFLTAKAVARRTTYNIPIVESDLPVTPNYIAQVGGVSGVTVLYASKWINGVVVAVTNTAALSSINSFSFVSSTAPVNRYKLSDDSNLPDEMQMQAMNRKPSKLQAGPSGRSFWQNALLQVDCLHGQGYRGQGMTIAVLDAGFKFVDVNPVFDSLRNRGGILGTRDFVDGGNSVYEDDTHGAAVLSCMAAIRPNIILGSAPMADYWLLRTEDNASAFPLNESPSEEYNWIRGAEFADSVGVDILTTSLGYTTFDKSQYNHTYSHLDGKTSPMSIAATMAARKGMLVLNAAGNEGGGAWQFIGIPADADSIITVGAIDSLQNVASFSSKGPTADGRIKPDLMSRGVSAWVSFAADGSCVAGNGTSFSTPILAGAIACFWQVHKTFNNIKVMDTLRHTATNAASPNNSRGWGVPKMCAIPASINKHSLDGKIQASIVPNPFASNFEIVFEESLGTSVQVQIFNATGMLVKKIYESHVEHKLNCDLSELSSGIYLLRIKGPTTVLNKKVIKQ
jgi:serine protease AprX